MIYQAARFRSVAKISHGPIIQPRLVGQQVEVAGVEVVVEARSPAAQA